VNLALKGWLGRKLSAQVLVGLQAMGSGHLALRLPSPCAGQTKRHMAHELPYPCAEQTRAPPDTWAAPVRGAEPAPPGAWVLAKGSIGYGSPSATWRLGKLDALFML